MADLGMVSFVSHCPYGHAPTQAFEPARLRELLDSRALEFYCGLGDCSWRPDADEQGRIAAWLAER